MKKIELYNYNEMAFIMSLYLLHKIPHQAQIVAILTIHAQILIQNPHLLSTNTQNNGNS